MADELKKGRKTAILKKHTIKIECKNWLFTQWTKKIEKKSKIYVDLPLEMHEKEAICKCIETEPNDIEIRAKKMNWREICRYNWCFYLPMNTKYQLVGFTALCDRICIVSNMTDVVASMNGIVCFWYFFLLFYISIIIIDLYKHELEHETYIIQ